MKEWLATVFLAAGSGAIFAWSMTSSYYHNRIDELHAAERAAIQEAKDAHAESLRKATDTILLAQDEYDAVRRERDDALRRLRDSVRGSGSSGGSADATARARIAALEKVVERLTQRLAECSDGWGRCAKKHDALVELIRK